MSRPGSRRSSFLLALGVGVCAAAGLGVAAEPGQATFAARRDKLLAALPPDGVAVFHSSPADRGQASESYRQDSDLFYLTGIPEPEVIAVLRPGAGGSRLALFVQPKSFADEQWTGFRAGLEGARASYGADEAYPIAEFWERWPDLQRGRGALFFRDGQDSAFAARLIEAWRKGDANSTKPRSLADAGPLVHEMRLVKDAGEIALLRRASELSVDAHLAAMAEVRPGNFEYALKAAMVRTCMAGGAARMGYPPIVGSGPNAVILHYDAANQPLAAGGMIVNDTACEFGMYTADVTRSYPVSGRWSPEQRAIYDIVLAAQKAGIAAARPGVSMGEVYGTTVDVVVDGLLRLGLLKGDKAQLIASRDFMKLYPHGSSHWLGLDVHDAGSYDRDEAMKERKDRYFAQRRKLAPGMVITVEPGLYFIDPVLEPALADPRYAPYLVPEVLARFRGLGGVRIE
ncbi:MAG TPA: aminopeptidase P N-terminal domain-containing protein, partial [Vicinamibacteria bacterium]